MSTVYEIVTNKIIEQLEKGVAPWTRPWVPRNAPKNIAGRLYTGINPFLLQAAKDAGGYDLNIWLTFNQVKAMGGDVKGEHTSLVVFMKHYEAKNEDGEFDHEGFMLRYYQVFNICQVKGIEKPQPEPVGEDIDPIEVAELVIAQMPNAPEIKLGQSLAGYYPQLDRIDMPARADFKTNVGYYGTLFHELTHSTADPKRLNRNVGNHRFGSVDYSKEELVAEMGASFLLGHCGIATDFEIKNSAAYLQSWLNALKNDHRMVVQAASAAQRAADYILGLKQPEPVAA